MSKPLQRGAQVGEAIQRTLGCSIPNPSFLWVPTLLFPFLCSSPPFSPLLVQNIQWNLIFKLFVAILNIGSISVLKSSRQATSIQLRKQAFGIPPPGPKWDFRGAQTIPTHSLAGAGNLLTVDTGEGDEVMVGGGGEDSSFFLLQLLLLFFYYDHLSHF